MSAFRIERILVLPEEYTASTMYIMKSEEEGKVDLFFTGTDVTDVRKVIGTSDVNEIVLASLANFNTLEIAATIDARDDLVLSRNCLVLVLDATGDVTVDTGAALYAYDKNTTLFYKVSQFEPSGATVDWTEVGNRPESAPSAIDTAVGLAHGHSNKEIIDGLSEDEDGNLLYNGQGISAVLAVSEW